MIVPHGVSVVVCCHNSAARLPETLRHLAAQVDVDDIAWEVLVIDNASSDGTPEIARGIWPTEAPAPLRVIHEPRLGLSHARERARREARYEYISFIDDDNWVSPQWVTTVNAVLTAHPEVGLCGGRNSPVFETPPPAWFESFKLWFAVGEQAAEEGRTTFHLWGAGLSIRKSAWEALLASGFEQRLTDRTGKALLSGGDTELCLALRLCGWHQWYDPRLELQHFIPTSRLTWPYLRRVIRGSGVSSVLLAPYAMALRGDPITLMSRLRQSWLWLVQAALRDLFSCRRLLFRMIRRPSEGSAEELHTEWRIGRLVGLWRYAFRYGQVLSAVRRTQWTHNETSRRELAKT